MSDTATTHNLAAKEKEKVQTDTADERTVVPTPERVDSVNGEKQNDVERAIAEEKDGLPAPIEIPDGGWTAWMTVAGAWLILFSTFGMTNAYGVYQDFYVRFWLRDYTPTTIGWIGSVQLFFQFSMGLFAGKLFDAGYFYQMVGFFSLLYVFAYYMLSLTQENAFYQVFLTQGVAAGIGLGFLFLPSLGVIAHHFKRRRSLAMGLVVSGSSFGGLVFPIMLNKLIQQNGFAQATRAVAYVCTGAMFLAMLLMRTRLPAPGKVAKAAKKEGATAPEGSKPNAPPMITALDLLKNPTYMITVAGSFFNLIGIFTPLFFLQTYAVKHGVDQNLAFYTITILNGASVIGRILPNFAGDIYGPYNAIIICTIACVVLEFALLGATAAPGILTIGALYGLFSGAYISLISPLFASLADNIQEIGMRMGLAFTILSIAGLIGTPIQGALLTQEFFWVRPFSFSGACMVVGVICLSIGRYLHSQKKGTWKV